MIRQLLYLHGFRSSPQSAKAGLTAQWIATHRPEVRWHCPQLPPSPRAAIEQIEAEVRDWPPETTAVIGSSLGGYYATALAERHGWRAALLNPAVDPARDLARYIGELTAWHSDDRFWFRPDFIDELVAMRPATLTRLDRYLAIVAKGDEVLSWTEMADRYRGCRIDLLEGNDHALSDFADRIDGVMRFLGLAD